MAFSAKKKRVIKENLIGFMLIAPVLIGLLGFVLYPMLESVYNSFFDYQILFGRTNFGISNYKKIFTNDPDFIKAVVNTLIYAGISIPLNLILSFCVALLLSRAFRGMKAFRLVYYLPVIIPSVISGFIWRDVFAVRYGIGNKLLGLAGLPRSNFFQGVNSAMPTFIFMNLFGLGGGMVLWLAALKSIPRTYYEAARIDGSSKVRSLFTITLPLITPYILYNLITGIIGALQVFGTSMVIAGPGGGYQKSLLFYVLYIYQRGLVRFDIGYASALSWVLFVVIAGLTLITFRSSKKWVNY